MQSKKEISMGIVFHVREFRAYIRATAEAAETFSIGTAKRINRSS